MVRNVAPVMRDLEPEDFYLLSGLEHGMRFSEWVDRRKLPSYAGLDAEEVDYRLDRCLRFELIERRTMQYEGYQLLFEGYDALALRTFSERETITGVGAPLGEGKESDVLEVRNGTPGALKFHREGLTNFREVQREREYTADRDHVSWLYTARKAAEREYDVLQQLHTRARVPKPIDHNRHAIVMERLDGVELANAGLAAVRAKPVLQEILSQLATVYEAGIVHTDASEYNVLISPEEIVLIDWPQAVPTDHPNATELLERDVGNVVQFFVRKYPSLFPEDPDIPRLSTLVQENAVSEWSALANI